MILTVHLFGEFRQYQSGSEVRLTLENPKTIREVREALKLYAQEHWRNFKPGLLTISAFADETQILRDSAPVPASGELFVMPPVSGG